MYASKIFVPYGILEVDKIYQLLSITPLDLPSAPGLNVTPIDLETFNFTISPPSPPTQCISHYNITANSAGYTPTEFTAEVVVREEPVTVTRSGFNFCNNSYNFSAVAATQGGIGERSDSVILQPFSSLSKTLG